jgi:two-component system, chemotaxis family, chemotaxis protein CheY
MAPRVLIVDDSKFMRLAVRKLIEEFGGFEVAGEAGSDLEAVERYKELRPDVVTMDIIMPASSGLKALALIREFDPAARVVMVTAMGQESVTQEALSLGAKGFVFKPVKQPDLMESLKKALE